MSDPKGRLTRWDGTTEVEREPQKGQMDRRCRHQGVWRSIGLSELGVPERQDFVRLTFGKTKWTD